MSFTERQRIVIETNLARDRAETLLRELIDANRAVQIHNVTKARPTMECCDGMDRAISSSRRLIDLLNRGLEVSEFDLLDDEMSLVDEFSLLDPIEDAGDLESGAFEALLRVEGILGAGAGATSSNTTSGLEQQSMELVVGCGGKTGVSTCGQSGLATASDPMFDLPV